MLSWRFRPRRCEECNLRHLLDWQQGDTLSRDVIAHIAAGIAIQCCAKDLGIDTPKTTQVVPTCVSLVSASF